MAIISSWVELVFGAEHADGDQRDAALVLACARARALALA